MPPPGHDVRVGVLLAPSRPERYQISPPTRLPRGSLILAITAASCGSPPPGRRAAALGAGSPPRRGKVTGTLAGRVQLRHRLVQVHPDPPDQPGCADQLSERLAERRIRRG